MPNINNLFILLSKLNITAQELSKATKISNGNISDWKSGRSLPTATKLYTLANYLGCSVDYLLGRTDVLEAPASSDLTGSESELLRSFRSLNAEGREKLTEYADDLVSSKKYEEYYQAKLGKEA